MNYPKISIVTPSYNQGQYLEETICSVLQQGYPNLEYIIMDGGSTDESVTIIKKYADQVKFWVSEPDKGQADAINKGLLHCTGEIFNWLNSDDYLEPGALFKIAEAFNRPEVGMVAGKVRNFSTEKSEYVQNKQLSAVGLMRWLPGVQFVQPGVWMRLKPIQACGGIDAQFHYCFDWDLYIRYLSMYPVVNEIDDLLIHFRLHPESKTVNFQERFNREELLIIEKIYQLPQFKTLHPDCNFKIKKAGWTNFLSNLSRSDAGFLSKLYTVLINMLAFKEVSFTRQTLGALRAFSQNRIL
jgi:glycosyltransferase involved in cell wall biosynthesis